ncbi:MAG TPA: ribosome silencing factor [Spirochaetota bacterium]|nr:ribosome silencing factor [Spirochaetota bacterium]
MMKNDNKETLIEIKDILEEKKGVDITFMDLSGIHSYLHYFVIVTANSRIHSRTLSAEVSRKLVEAGFNTRVTPNEPSGWTIVDAFDIVVHIFLEEERDYYNLEYLWADAILPEVASIGGQTV